MTRRLLRWPCHSFFLACIPLTLVAAEPANLLAHPAFNDSWKKGTAFVPGYADGGGIVTTDTAGSTPRIIVTDTTGEPSSSRASTFRLTFPADSLVVTRINAILAQPAATAPVSFRFSTRIERLAASSRLVWARFGGAFTGKEAPKQPLFIGDTDLRRHSSYRVGDGAQVYDDRVIPALRFTISGTGGSKRIDGLNIELVVRVDNDGAPERIALEEPTITEVPAMAVAAPPTKSLIPVGSAASPDFLAAASAAGWNTRPASTDIPGDGDLILVAQSCADEAVAKQVVAALDRGAAVVYAANGKAPHARLDARLPVNAWSYAEDRLLRGDALLLPQIGGGFTSVTGLLSVGNRYDVHLPGAPIENGMMRYEHEQYGKGLLVSDWRSELQTSADSRLPFLITARSGPGRIAVVAGDLWDPTLITSPGYTSFCVALLAWAKPESVAVALKGNPASLTLSIPRHQPQGLGVDVANPTKASITATVSWRTASWSYEHLSARTQTIEVPAQGLLHVSCADAVPDSAIPWRRVEVAILAHDRRSIVTEDAAPVSIAGPLGIAIISPPPSDAEMKGPVIPVNDGWLDGRMAQRYGYQLGTSPQVTIRLTNGLINIAPLATATDRVNPSNRTIGGLNDGSYSLSNVKGKGPWQGAWAGKPAAEQRLNLAWPMPVTLVSYRLVGYGVKRKWNNANPTRHVVAAISDGKADGKEVQLSTQDNAEFSARRGKDYAYFDKNFDAAVVASSCSLNITGLDPKADIEPRGDGPSNCSLVEWELTGWPAAQPPPAVVGELVITWIDQVLSTRTELLREKISLASLAAVERTSKIPAHNATGPMRLEICFTVGGKKITETNDYLFVTPDGTQMINKEQRADLEVGLLCSPGWRDTMDFGIGMRSQTQGWGGDDDQIWALTHNQIESNRSVRGKLDRMFTTEMRFHHYTNPFRDTPGGFYGFDLAMDPILERAARQGKKRVHVFGSDRWNGIYVGQCYGWPEFISFDQSLKAAGGPGLKGRTLGQISDEIDTLYGDRWQRWNLERYADKLLETQKKFAARGHEFMFESHGSFPLCGGELGAKLAKTHVGVGTDLFWELRNQDLYWSLGTRFGVIAANPDLQSGAYGQWGWVNSVCNRWWFANNSGQDPARRQWYATYFTGRVDTSGKFQPYHMTGYSWQGGVSTKMYADDIVANARVGQLTGWIRPEKPAGMGMVVSWATQERRMGPTLDDAGFGLYAGKGRMQIDELMGHAYQRLVKNGLPVSFVTSTFALKAWNGTQPLVLVDAFSWAADELSQLDRLNRAGVPLLCIGDANEVESAQLVGSLFGVQKSGTTWVAAAGTRREEMPGGTVRFVCTRPGRGTTVWCPSAVDALPMRAAQALVDVFTTESGNGLRLAPGLTCTPAVSRGALWLPLCDQGDEARAVEIVVRPASYLPVRGVPKAVDLDDDMTLTQTWDAATGQLTITIPRMPACGGKMLMISGGAP